MTMVYSPGLGCVLVLNMFILDSSLWSVVDLVDSGN